jgi:hypothetical protein
MQVGALVESRVPSRGFQQPLVWLTWQVLAESHRDLSRFLADVTAMYAASGLSGACGAARGGILDSWFLIRVEELIHFFKHHNWDLKNREALRTSITILLLPSS